MRPVVAVLALACASAVSPRAWCQSIADDLGSDDLAPVPVTRIALGPVASFEPEVHPELALDATVGATAMRWLDGGLALNVEAGYAYESGHGADDLHAGTATVGVGYGQGALFATYQPRLVVGSHGGAFAIGMRNGIVAHLLADTFTAELAHQLVSTSAAGDDLLRHDVRVLIGFNPAPFVYGLLELRDSLR